MTTGLGSLRHCPSHTTHGYVHTYASPDGFTGNRNPQTALQGLTLRFIGLASSLRTFLWFLFVCLLLMITSSAQVSCFLLGVLGRGNRLCQGLQSHLRSWLHSGGSRGGSREATREVVQGTVSGPGRQMWAGREPGEGGARPWIRDRRGSHSVLLR